MVKHWKKGILPVLAAILVLSLAACSGSPSASNGGKSSDGTGGSGSDSKQVNATALAKAIKNDKVRLRVASSIMHSCLIPLLKAF